MCRDESVALLDDALAVQGARNDGLPRTLGFTNRKTADLIIGTLCIAHGHDRLPNNRDIDPMAKHLGLLAALAAKGRARLSGNLKLVSLPALVPRAPPI